METQEPLWTLISTESVLKPKISAPKILDSGLRKLQSFIQITWNDFFLPLTLHLNHSWCLTDFKTSQALKRIIKTLQPPHRLNLKDLNAMDENIGSIEEFFNQLWSFATEKHNQGVYNTVCLIVLLTLPLLVLLTTLVVCCHCCCCRHANRCCSCCCRDSTASTRSEAKKKKNSSNNTEDLWISVKTGPMTPDRVALAMV